MGKANKLPLNFYILIFSRLTSSFGTFLNMMAINIFILELTKTAYWIGIIMGCRVVSGIIASPMLGYMADKFNRKFLMIISDIILALAIILLIFIPHLYIKYYVIFAMMMIGIFSNLYEICLRSAIPVILDEKNTLKANSILMGGTNLTMALSSLCAIFAYYIFKNYTSIFVLDSATYLISGIVLFTLKIKTVQKESVDPEQAKETIVEQKSPSFLKKLKNEYADILLLDNFKVIAICLFILLLDAFASASHNIGWPVFSKSLNAEKPMFFYGVILFSWAIGNVVGIFFLNKLNILKTIKPEKLYLFFTAVMSTGMILTFQTSFFTAISLAAFIAGVGDGTYQTYFTTYVQKVKDSLRGKIFALTSLVMKTGFGFGFVVVPLVLNYFSVGKTVLFFHLPIVILTISYLLFINMKEKNIVFNLKESEIE